MAVVGKPYRNTKNEISSVFGIIACRCLCFLVRPFKPCRVT
jgi:hypothetical protein